MWKRHSQKLLLAGNVTITGQATGVNSISYDEGTCSVSVSVHPADDLSCVMTGHQVTSEVT